MYINNVTLTITKNCNLRCQYCFVTKSEVRGAMPLDIVQRSVQFLLDQLRRSQSKTTGTITFFGGEPLLFWSMIKKIVEYAITEANDAHYQMEFMLSTNGTLLDAEKLAFIRQHKIFTDISIDSHNETIHNNLRPFANGKGSFRRIVANLRLLRKGDPVGIKATITPTNIGLVDYFAHFSKPGTLSSIAFSPFFSAGCTDNFSEHDVERYRIELEAYANFLVENWSKGKIVSPERNLLSLIRLLASEREGKSLSSCLAASRSIVVSMNGDIYPCEPLADIPDFYLGNIQSGFDNQLREKMIERINSKNKKGCENCPAKAWCGESCISCSYVMGNCDSGDKALGAIMRYNFLIAEALLEKIDTLTKQ